MFTESFLGRLLILAFTPCDECFSLKSVSERFLPGWCTRGRGGSLKVLVVVGQSS